jgi:hypothetical protein
MRAVVTGWGTCPASWSSLLSDTGSDPAPPPLGAVGAGAPLPAGAPRRSACPVGVGSAPAASERAAVSTPRGDSYPSEWWSASYPSPLSLGWVEGAPTLEAGLDPRTLTAGVGVGTATLARSMKGGGS